MLLAELEEIQQMWTRKVNQIQDKRGAVLRALENEELNRSSPKQLGLIIEFPKERQKTA